MIAVAALLSACGGEERTNSGGSAPPPPAQNRPPQISGSPASTVVAGNPYSFVPQASDPDGQTLSFSISGKPTWATFDTATGRLSGTPTAAQVGTYGNIVISVSDGMASASLPAFAVQVTAPPPTNRPPVISGTPPTTVQAGQTYSFQPTASDPDGQTLTFTIANRPAWASFNASTGRLSGTPTAAQVGTYANVTIAVSDGTASVSLPPFTIQVTGAPPANRPPVISGSPPTSATVWQSYSFTPTASDPDGQSLTFSITNKPSWATFNTSTGQLTGTPTTAHLGTTSNIVVTVSDGTASTSLPAFSIAVVMPPGVAELTWTRPTRNEDGSNLTDLAGYRIRYGTASNALNQTFSVNNPGTTTASIEGLAAGTWYFSIVSYTTSGVESAPTGPVNATVR
ncbi:MAG: putative Ig domain-containing protein [Steroidobacteraceae bacterium]|nr:putative Ig domain-containing protein [Steroidobacteraceae bacterium]MDW8258533.1 putative Ig domain-containing protein [Gammaproteobacteria bacterium]